MLATAAAAFAPTLTGGFLGDDFVYVARFHEFPWRDWPRLFTHEWSEGIWGFPLAELRPFTALTLMIDGRLFGGHAVGYRLTNLLMHLGVVFAVMMMTWRYSRGSVAGMVTAGLCFALHPTHLEPVSWITGRVDVFSTLCALCFWLAAETWADRGGIWRVGLAALFLFVGVFAKELCLFAPPLLLLRWVLVSARAGRAIWLRRIILLLAVVGVAVFYTKCRRAAFGPGATVPGSTWHNAAAWQRQASYLAWLAPILPFKEQAELKSPPPIPLLRGAGISLAALIVASLLAAAWRRSERVGNALFFTGGWWLVTVGGLLLVGYFSPRHLYFPTTGLAIGVGLVIALLGPAGQDVRNARESDQPSRNRGYTGLQIALASVLALWLGAAHLVYLRAWVQNGRLSREIETAFRNDFAKAPPGSLAFSAVPETLHNAWLWSWASPHALGKPFLDPPIAGEKVFSRPGAHYQPERWAETFRPLPAVQAAPGAVAVTVSADGRVLHRILSASELASHTPSLAAFAANGVDGGEWITWVNSLFPQ